MYNKFKNLKYIRNRSALAVKTFKTLVKHTGKKQMNNIKTTQIKEQQLWTSE